MKYIFVTIFHLFCELAQAIKYETVKFGRTEYRLSTRPISSSYLISTLALKAALIIYVRKRTPENTLSLMPEEDISP